MQSELPPFQATLQKFTGKGAWTYVLVPPSHAPRDRMAFGRCPVTASIDGRTWETAVWQEKTGRCILAVPKKHRGKKGNGDLVKIWLDYPFQKIDPDDYRRYI